MKKLLLLPILLFPVLGICQQWQTIQGSEFTAEGYFAGCANMEHRFKINPYDNSVWMSLNILKGKIHGFTTEGNFLEYSYENEPLFIDDQILFGNIEFIDGKTFVVSENRGLFSFDGLNWNQESTAVNGFHLCRDEDTLWMGRTGGGFLVWSEGTASIAPDNAARIVSKNGKAWVGSSATLGISSYDELSGATLYSPDTSNLLSWENFDFKYSNLSDSLYTASDRGISIAYNGMFVDSITPNNSTNMPSSSIVEFEFDQDDNIWALFSPGIVPISDVTHVAYYDQATKDWIHVYDESNSPIEFGSMMSIEVDTAGNPWVTNGENIYVLKLQNWPQWLDIDENYLTTELTVHPNPTNGTVNLNVSEQVHPELVTILDVSGRIVWSVPFSEKIQLDLPSGSYFLQVSSDQGVLTEKLVIE